MDECDQPAVAGADIEMIAAFGEYRAAMFVAPVRIGSVLSPLRVPDVLGIELRAHCRSVRFGAVICNDDFEILVGLLVECDKDGSKRVVTIERGDDDGKYAKSARRAAMAWKRPLQLCHIVDITETGRPGPIPMRTGCRNVDCLLSGYDRTDPLGLGRSAVDVPGKRTVGGALRRFSLARAGGRPCWRNGCTSGSCPR